MVAKGMEVMAVVMAAVVALGSLAQQLQQLGVGDNNEPWRVRRQLKHNVVLLAGSVHDVRCSVPSKQFAESRVTSEGVRFEVQRGSTQVDHGASRKCRSRVKRNEASRWR